MREKGKFGKSPGHAQLSHHVSSWVTCVNLGGVSVKGGGNLGCDIKRLILHRFQSTILYTTGFSQLCCFVSEGDFNKIFSYCFHIKEAPEFLLVIVSLMLWGTVS